MMMATPTDRHHSGGTGSGYLVAMSGDGASAVGGVGAGDLGPALALLPTEEHRAFLRLVLSATIARHHLGARNPSGWPGFLATGPTKTAKTLCALGPWAPSGSTLPATCARPPPRRSALFGADGPRHPAGAGASSRPGCWAGPWWCWTSSTRRRRPCREPVSNSSRVR